MGWKSVTGTEAITRTDIAGDLLALIRHLGGGPAVIVGHSISGGAATIAAATRPDLVAGIVEINPFTRTVHYSLGGLLRVRRYRRCAFLLTGTQVFRSLAVRMRYLDLAYPAKPADYAGYRAALAAKLREPGRMAEFLKTFNSPADAALAGRHASRRLLASRPPGHGPGPGLARPHRPGPAPRHGTEVQRPLHPHPPRRPPGRQGARPRPLDGPYLDAAPNGEFCAQPLVSSTQRQTTPN
jgi:pimeloyl-ACP methyl ester carboxylesterase